MELYIEFYILLQNFEIAMREVIESKWIDCFEQVFKLCDVGKGDLVAVLSESQSRQVLVDPADLGLQRCRARVVHVRVPSPKLREPVPVRSTGSSQAFVGYGEFLNSSEFLQSGDRLYR